MEAKKLEAALLELKARGWPVKLWGPHKDGECGVEVIYPDGGYDYCNYLYADGFQYQRDAVKLQGWAVACLEARGLERCVWPEHNAVNVSVGTPGKPNEPNTFNAIDERVRRTELEALLACCLALPPDLAPERAREDGA